MGLYLSPSINWVSTNDDTETSSNIGFNYGYGIEFSISENTTTFALLSSRGANKIIHSHV